MRVMRCPCRESGVTACSESAQQRFDGVLAPAGVAAGDGGGVRPVAPLVSRVDDNLHAVLSLQALDGCAPRPNYVTGLARRYAHRLRPVHRPR